MEACYDDKERRNAGRRQEAKCHRETRLIDASIASRGEGQGGAFPILGKSITRQKVGPSVALSWCDDMGDLHLFPGEHTKAPLLLTIPEVAEILRTSPKAVYTMTERGQLPGVVRIGRRILIKRSELLIFLDRNSTPSH
jgi:excisionase family DNA binding protein